MRSPDEQAARARTHALQRLNERFGLDIGLSGLAWIETQIRDRAASYLGQMANERQVWRVVWPQPFKAGVPMVVVFEPGIDACVTVLKPEAIVAFIDEPAPATATLAELIKRHD